MFARDGRSAFVRFFTCLSMLAAGCVIVTAQELDPPRSEPPAAEAPAAEPRRETGSESFWVRVTGDRVNLRSRADVNSLPLARLDRGSYLHVRGGEADWYRVDPPAGVFSLVSAEYVEVLGEGRGVVKLDSGELRVRVGSRVANVDPLLAEVQTMLRRGEEVEILGQDGGWLRIRPPTGVYAFISQPYAERVSEDVVERVGGRPRVVYSDEDEPERRAEAPAEPDLGGAWGQKLRAVEARVQVEGGKPPLERDWQSLLGDLGPIAEQREEPQVAQRAAGWVSQLELRVREQERLRVAQEAAQRQAGERREAQERARRAAQRDPDKPAFDVVGQLLPSFALEAGEHGLRYKLVDPLTERVQIYVEFPSELKVDLKAVVGKYVGVRGERYLDPQHGVEVLRATSVTVVTSRPQPKR